jgi:GalNAc5-diNAcBac-PP-undecaprenol beta-1,3-glucosyltransferase
MSLAATVLVPTHDHAETLLRSVRSALAQTVEEIEVFIVGDGAPDRTREIAAELSAEDQRVRFFDNPKGERHGELHRHAALQEARGEIVCYLADDDLWLPAHVEEMRRLLDGADFAHSLAFWLDVDGKARPLRVDLGLPHFRELLQSGENRVPLSCAAHTLELYRRLPTGWRPAPRSIFSDLYMWQQILAVPGCRARSGSRATALSLPTPAREGWSAEQRLDELDTWSVRLAEPGLEESLRTQVLEALAREGEELEALLARAVLDRDWLAGERDWLAGEVRRHERRVAELEARVAVLEDAERQLAELSTSVTWRLRLRLLAVPGLRGAARALARRAAGPETGSARHAQTPAPPVPATESPEPDPPSDSQARRSGPSTP